VDITNTSYDAAAGTTANLLVHAFAGKKSYFQKFRRFVNEVLDSFARSQFALLVLLLYFFFTAAEPRLFFF
jgi:hypothetical protein